MCRATGCYQTHSYHYCRICKDENSNHISEHCPEGITVYHGTYTENVQSILQNGFRISSEGRMGPGAYFAGQLVVAKAIAKNRWKCTEIGKKADYSNQYKACSVLECRISKYKTVEVDTNSGATWGIGALVSAPLLFLGPPGWLAYIGGNAVSGMFCAINSTTQQKRNVGSGNHPPWKGVVERNFDEYVVQKSNVSSIRVLRVHSV